MRALRKLAAFAVVAVLSTLLVGTNAVRAQTAYSVDVAAQLGTPAREGMRFYAPSMKVHQGDTITFNNPGFHTATLLPENTDVHSWVPANAGGVGKAYSLFVPDPDDGGTTAQPALKANNAVLFGDPACGGPGQPACTYDGSQVVNSGVGVFGPGSFTVTIDANPGDVVWVICLIHPHMRLRVEVVPGGTTPTTQAEIDAFKASRVATDTEEALALHNRLLSRQTKHTAGGKTVWDAYAGYDTHTISLFGMYPKRLTIRKGQTVRWHFGQLVYEDHTVTMPARKGMEIANAEFFAPACDPDGDAGAGPDGPPQIQGPPFCTDPAQLEFDISPRIAYGAGDGVFRGRSDFEHSGINGAAVELGSSPYDVKFTKVSNDKGWAYVCVIHPGMRGRVRVR